MQVVDHGLAALTPDGRMLLAATSAMGTRLVKHASRARDRRLVEFRRRKGNVVLEITRRG